MFTRCPECQTTQPLSLEQLRNSRGMLECCHCAKLFDALALLSETEDEANEQIFRAHDTSLPWDEESHSRSSFWGLGVALCSALLVVQIIYFNGESYPQNARIRPLLITLCDYLGCQLPDYNNLHQISLIGSFNPMPDQNYEFHAAISNQSPFFQAFPNIRLTLLSFNGRPFAARIFLPQDYLPGPMHKSKMKPTITTEINLKIAAPRSAIGGSSFELVD